MSAPSEAAVSKLNNPAWPKVVVPTSEKYRANFFELTVWVSEDKVRRTNHK